MGTSASKARRHNSYPVGPQVYGQQPYPQSYIPQPYGHAYMPQSFAPVVPIGAQKHNGMPPGFAPTYNPVQAMPWPALMNPPKQKKRKVGSNTVYPDGFQPPNTFQVQPPVGSQMHREPHHHYRDTNHGHSQAGFIPPPPALSSQGPVIPPSSRAPIPPLFTPSANPRLENFPAPEAGTNHGRRPQTPGIRFQSPSDHEDNVRRDHQHQPPQQQRQPRHRRHRSHLDEPLETNLSDLVQPFSPAHPFVSGPSRSTTRPGGGGGGLPSNPLPDPPRDIYEFSPFKHVLNLPDISSYINGPTSTIAAVQVPLGRSRTQASGSVGAQDKQKKTRKGLFRSFSLKRGGSKDDSEKEQAQPRFIQLQPRMVNGVSTNSNTNMPVPAVGTPMPPPPVLNGSASGAHHQTPQPTAGPSGTSSGSGMGSSSSGTSQTTSTPQQTPTPIRFDQQSMFGDFMNHSPHRVIYRNVTYPTATHLHEAMKYIDEYPDLAERIRQCPHAKDVYPLSKSFETYQRKDWGQVFMQVMEEVILHKLRQHPNLRSMLLNTGFNSLVYADPEDEYWGEGPLGQGLNELGKVLVRVRERLRAENGGI